MCFWKTITSLYIMHNFLIKQRCKLPETFYWWTNWIFYKRNYDITHVKNLLEKFLIFNSIAAHCYALLCIVTHCCACLTLLIIRSIIANVQTYYTDICMSCIKTIHHNVWRVSHTFIFVLIYFSFAPTRCK